MSIRWYDLTQWEQGSLLAIYDIDQQQEAFEQKQVEERGTYRRANRWRWIDYAILDGRDTPLKSRIALHLASSEAPTTVFEALARYRLIDCRSTHVDRDGNLRPEEIIAVQITRQGRKLIRQTLGLQARARQLTQNQQYYVDMIVEAGLAEREEVEAAFRDRSGEGHEKIRAWGRTLYQRSKEKERQNDGVAQGVVTSSKKKPLFYHPKGEDNP